MGRKKSYFGESALNNKQSFTHYLNRLIELSISMFEWSGLPRTVDPRYLELALFYDGNAVFFEDDVVGFLCLNNINNGNFDVYGNPVKRRAYSRYNNYQKILTEKDSVVIWNNMLRTNSYQMAEIYAKRLWSLDRIADINCNAQKTPILLQGSEKQRLTLINAWKEYDGNAPVICADNNFDISGLKSIKTEAPFVADKIHTMKNQIWNEALTWLGISNVSFQKKERIISDEVARQMGGTMASRYSRLNARKEACEKINAMFGLDVSVEYRETPDVVDSTDGLGGLDNE